MSAARADASLSATGGVLPPAGREGIAIGVAAGGVLF